MTAEFKSSSQRRTKALRTYADKYVMNRFTLLLLGMLCIFADDLWANTKIQVKNDAQIVHVKSGKVETLKANESLEVDLSQPIWVSEIGRLPILLVPTDSTEQMISVSAPSQRRDGKPPVDSLSLDQTLSDLLRQFVEVQTMVRDKNFTGALNKVYALKTKYPDVQFLEFLLASVLVVNGKKQEAQKALNRGLASHPDYQEGQELLRKLEDKGE